MGGVDPFEMDWKIILSCYTRKQRGNKIDKIIFIVQYRSPVT